MAARAATAVDVAVVGVVAAAAAMADQPTKFPPDLLGLPQLPEWLLWMLSEWPLSPSAAA